MSLSAKLPGKVNTDTILNALLVATGLVMIATGKIELGMALIVAGTTAKSIREALDKSDG
jgi:hypothetical protein